MAAVAEVKIAKNAAPMKPGIGSIECISALEGSCAQLVRSRLKVLSEACGEALAFKVIGDALGLVDRFDLKPSFAKTALAFAWKLNSVGDSAPPECVADVPAHHMIALVNMYSDFS